MAFEVFHRCPSCAQSKIKTDVFRCAKCQAVFCVRCGPCSRCGNTARSHLGKIT